MLLERQSKVGDWLRLKKTSPWRGRTERAATQVCIDDSHSPMSSALKAKKSAAC